MRTITISADSTEIYQLLEEAAQEDLIVKLADGRQFILSAIDDFDLEIAQTRRNEKLMKFLDEQNKQPKGISLDEVKQKLGLL